MAWRALTMSLIMTRMTNFWRLVLVVWPLAQLGLAE
jgi:hypothetical protein